MYFYIYLFISAFNYLFIHVFMYFYIYLFIYFCIYVFIHLLYLSNFPSSIPLLICCTTWLWFGKQKFSKMLLHWLFLLLF